jgi:hypothetical protein
MKKVICSLILVFILVGFKIQWGFFAHQQINRLAVFTLPPEMMPFFKHNIGYLSENAVNPDKRRYILQNEAPRHYIDLDVYGDSAKHLPHFWKDAVIKYTEDSLLKHGIVPWHIQLMKYQLTEAFKERNAPKILKLSADLGHYIADANVPLHTTKNYNGQLTGQEGIHAFWESRLPELFNNDYDFFVGKATYLPKPANTAWQAVWGANAALDSVLSFERALTVEMGENKKYSIEERNGQNIKTYSPEFSKKYHHLLDKQVERQMRTAIKMVGDFWYTAWVDAGQPDMKKLLDYKATEQEKEAENKEKQTWLQKIFNVRKEADN